MLWKCEDCGDTFDVIIDSPLICPECREREATHSECCDYFMGRWPESDICPGCGEHSITQWEYRKIYNHKEG